ncbi:MAG: ATP-binding protein [Ruminococcus sp.]|nr:ATP-binding protein [Ruminococcus sp.]
MMNEISLNILDVAENSVSAGASLCEIDVTADSEKDTLTVIIKDDGRGMSEEVVKKVSDPFYTTRTTRKVCMGTSLFKMAAECTGGRFEICSALGSGTTVTAVFGLSHIDRMPLGDISATIHTLMVMNTGLDWVYRFKFDENEFTVDTREIKEATDGVPIDDPDVSGFIRDMLRENHAECKADNL